MPAKNNQPKISIIVTAFNDEKYIDACLKSLKNQTLKNIEIIVVDDASNDKTIDKIKQHQKQCKNIQHIHFTKNQGPSAARNAGLKIAKAPYVMFCDGDDFYAKDCCEKMLRAMTDFHVDMACCEIKVIYEDENKIKFSDDDYYQLKFAGRKIITAKDVKKLDLSVDNKIFRMDVIKKHHLTFPKNLLYEDTYFVLAYLFLARHAFFLKEPLYYYTRHSGSIMDTTFSDKTKKDHSLDAIKIFDQLYDFLQKQSNKNPLTKDNTEIFFSQFGIFISSAKRWAKTRSKRQEINQFVKKFERENRVKIKTLRRHYLLAFAFKILGYFTKVSNSQRWTVAKLKNLKLKMEYKTIFSPEDRIKY